MVGVLVCLTKTLRLGAIEMTRRACLLSAALGAVCLMLTTARGDDPPKPTKFIGELTSAEWFTFGSPDGKVQTAYGYLLVKAMSGFGDGGRVGAIWRTKIERPKSGKRYVYIWRYKNRSALKPGRAYISLHKSERKLSALGKDDYFGVYLGVTPSSRLYARMIREGELAGYHHMPRVGDIDVRFVLTPTGQQLEVKASVRDKWIRLPVKSNPWKDTTKDAFYLHLESHGDPLGSASSDYGIRSVEIRDEDVAQPVL